jgi:hypothetical protein
MLLTYRTPSDRGQWFDYVLLHGTIPASAFFEAAVQLYDGYRRNRPVDCCARST